MARFVTFNGITKYTPGGLTKINAQALTPIGLSASGIVALIGEAEAGKPDTVISIDDPAEAKEIFRSGPLADAVGVAFDPSNDQRIPGGAQRVLAYKVNPSTQSTLQLPGDEAGTTDTADTGSTSTVINLTTGGLTADAEIGRWFEWSGERRRIVDNTTTSVTVSPGFSDAPSSSDAVKILDSQIILTSEDYGSHTAQTTVELEDGSAANTKVVTVTFEDQQEQSEDIGGNTYMRLKYIGGPVDDSGNVDSVSSDGADVTVDVTAAPTSNEWAGMILRFSNGIQREIASNTAADPAVITLISGHELTTAEASEVTNTTAEIVNVTSADASITGANGKATGMTSAVLPTADDISLTFSNENITTLRELVDWLNANTNYEAEAANGVNPDTTLVEDFDFGDRATTVDVRFDDVISPDDKGSFRQDLQEVINWINDHSDLVSAERATAGADEGSELPLNAADIGPAASSDSENLYGGTRGTSANSDWQDAFDAILKVRANGVVPLISEDLTNQGNGSTATFSSVAAQLKAHVQAARGANQTERAGYLGMSGTKTEIISQSQALNDTDVHLIPQTVKTLNVAGTLTTMGEWAAAVMAAGMRAGASEVGTPLTYKQPNTVAIDQDSSWDYKNLTDRNDFIKNGIMFMEEHPTAGFRWLRDITTHLASDNIALIDGNTRDAVRFVAYDLRTFLENQFTGEKAKPATVASIRELAAAKLKEYNNDNIIVESLDPQNPENGRRFPGFRNIRVTVSGNTATIKLEIFPVTGIVFQLSEIFLQLPTLSA